MPSELAKFADNFKLLLALRKTLSVAWVYPAKLGWIARLVAVSKSLDVQPNDEYDPS